MKEKEIVNSQKIDIILTRICHQLIENHTEFSETVIIGLQPRGVFFAKRIHAKLQTLIGKNINYGELDVTFFRDDFRRNEQPSQAKSTQIDFIIENKNVILIDDVLFTGRTIRAGFDALLHYGRPKKVELAILVERRMTHQFPIKADYLGLSTDTLQNQKIRVDWTGVDAKEDRIILISNE